MHQDLPKEGKQVQYDYMYSFIPINQGYHERMN